MTPETAQATLILAAFAFLCWGSWATLFKLAGAKWRFEHFYFDFAFGALVATLISGFALGSSGDGLTLVDSFLLTGRKQWALAAAAGAVFNLGNMLLLAAVEIRGMALAFPLAMAVGGLILTARVLFVNGDSGYGSVLTAAALCIASILLTVAAAGRLVRSSEPPPGNRKTAPKPSARKPVALAAAAGIFIALSAWPLRSARQGLGDIDMGPYALAILFCVGILLTTLVYNVYFINLPVHGEPAGFGPYFQGGFGVHFLGILGGAVFAGGLLAGFVVDEAENRAALSDGLRAILVPASAILAALWGWLVFREFRQAEGRASIFLALALACLAGGLAALAIRLGV